MISGYSGFRHILNWLPLYNWNMGESGIATTTEDVVF
jgi:hypothetical protein